MPLATSKQLSEMVEITKYAVRTGFYPLGDKKKKFVKVATPEADNCVKMTQLKEVEQDMRTRLKNKYSRLIQGWEWEFYDEKNPYKFKFRTEPDYGDLNRNITTRDLEEFKERFEEEISNLRNYQFEVDFESLY